MKLSLLFWAMLLSPEAADPPAAAAPRPWSRYQVLIERNPFSSERGQKRLRGEAQPAQSGGAAEQTSAETENPDRLLVLVGVVVAPGGPVAVLEDSLTGEVRRCPGGTELHRGRIADIDWNSLGYELEGVVRRVRVGEALAGGAVRRAAAAPRPAGTAPPAAGAAAGTSVLERLRAQRRRETGQ